MKITPIKKQVQEDLIENLIKKLEQNTVTVEMTELQLAILACVAMHVGGRNKARFVFSDQEDSLLVAARRHVGCPAKLERITNRLRDYFQMRFNTCGCYFEKPYEPTQD